MKKYIVMKKNILANIAAKNLNSKMDLNSMKKSIILKNPFLAAFVKKLLLVQNN